MSLPGPIASATSIPAAIVVALVLAVSMMTPSGPAVAADVSGTARAIDGNTLEIGKTRIRLFGIDAPALGQGCFGPSDAIYPCGLAARAKLGQLVNGRTIECSERGRGRRGSILAVCFAGRLDLNSVMVRNGYAVALTRHTEDYAADEEMARREHRGLWVGSFERPEEWRDAHPTPAPRP